MHRRNLLTLPLFALLLLGLLAAPASAGRFSQTIQPSFNLDPGAWVPDGPVFAIQSDPASGRAYLGGNFDSINPYTGHLIAAARSDGAILAGLPALDGPVYAIAGNPTDGWYVGGDFHSAGGQPRQYLLRLNADLTLDTAWKPVVDGPVYALYFRAETQVIYAGGAFQSIDGQPRANLAAISKSGVLRNWTPNPDGPVRALLLTLYQPSPILFVGGAFHHLGGQAVNALGAVDPNHTGSSTGWAPAPGFDAQAEVEALAALPNPDAINGNRAILAGGSFSIPTSGGAQIRYLAGYGMNGALDSGLDLKLDGPVHALLAKVENDLGDDDVPVKMYLGGSFTTIAGQPASGLARVETGDFAAYLPDPDFQFQLDGPVYSLTQPNMDNSELLVGGGFWQVQGKPQPGLFRTARSAPTGRYEALDWSPRIQYRNNAVRAAVYGKDQGWMLAGGDFFSAGGQRQHNLAALDPAGRSIPGWSAGTDGPVNALAVSGGSLFFGGQFAHITGQGVEKDCPNAGAVTTSGVSMDWCPRPDGPVSALAVYAPSGGPWIALGGDFQQVSGPAGGPTSRPYLALVRAADGSISPANPAPDHPVRALAAQNGVLFAGGSFTQMGGRTLRYAAGLDLSGGQVWALSPEAPVSALAVSGPRIYLAEESPNADPFQGQVEVFNWQQPGPALAGFGNLRGWLRAAAADPQWVITGGSFYGTPSLTGWNIGDAAPLPLPALTGGGGEAETSVRAIHISGERVMVGGGFSGAVGQEHPYLVMLTTKRVYTQKTFYLPFVGR